MPIYYVKAWRNKKDGTSEFSCRHLCGPFVSTRHEHGTNYNTRQLRKEIAYDTLKVMEDGVYPGMTAVPEAVRQVPHDTVAERSLIGGLLWNAERFYDVSEIVKAPAFYTQQHRHIFEAMGVVASRGESIDSVTVGTQLANENRLDMVGGRDYLAELVEQSPSTAYLRVMQKLFRINTHDAVCRKQDLPLLK